MASDHAPGSGRAAPGGYTVAARILHWITAVLVLAMIPVGFVMVDLGAGHVQDLLFHLHESVGATLLVIVAARLLYRLAHAPPPLSPDMPLRERQLAAAAHWALYGLLVVQPVIGWIGTSAYRAPIGIFWLFELPPIAPQNRAFSDTVFAVHTGVGVLLTVLIAVHAGAALFHHFVRRDGVLMRMVRG